LEVPVMIVSPVDRSVPYELLAEFLSPDEFRQYLGLSRNGVYELIRRNEIPHVRFGRLIRIPKSAPRITATA
jgi:excisionase family DNA binding protein